MQRSRLSKGGLIVSIGWLLSACAVVGGVSFAMLWLSIWTGGIARAYPSEAVYFVSWLLLGVGGIVSSLGVRILHRPVLLLFPLASVVVMLITLLSLPCFPIERCLVTP